MARKLFYEDPYRTEFDARVVGAERIDGNTSALRLDQTCFYPEGGGQPSDLGTIAGLQVSDVRKDGDDVLHIVTTTGADADAAGVSVGAEVRCRVDRERRRDYMQQHTGQHIISAALLEIGEYNTVSVHQGSDYTTIEVDRDDIREEDVVAVESRANEIVADDREITDHWVTDAELPKYPLRRPPKVSGSIRLVMIKDFDCVACGGVHFRRTAEVGPVKCIGTERIRGQVRTIWKIGERARLDYGLKHTVVSTLTTLLSAQPAEIVERVSGLQSQLVDTRRSITELQTRIAGLAAESLIGNANRVETEPGQTLDVVAGTVNGEDKETFRGILEALAARPNVVFCVLNVGADRLLWAVGSSASGPADVVPFDRVRRELLPVIDGKGGGKPPIWQGAASNVDGAPRFLEGFRALYR